MTYRYLVAPIKFEMMRHEEIEFTLSNARTVCFILENVKMGEDRHEHYEGSYSITPRVDAQYLETNDKVMDSDVTIFGIPNERVSNPQGGKTITIG